MERRFLRGRATAAFTGLVLAATFSAGAMAAPPERESFTATNISCEEALTSGDDTAALYDASVDARFGAGASLDIWADGADTSDVPTHTSNFEAPGTGSASATSLTVSQPLVLFDSGDPAGTAVITATFEAVGDPIRIRDVFRFGNAFERTIGTVQPLDITSGSMTALGVTYDLADCFAWATDATTFRSAPDAAIFHASGFSMNCEWPADEPVRFLLAEEFRGGGYVDVFFEDLMIGGSTDARVSPAGISTDIILTDFTSGDEYVSQLDASFERLGDPVVEILEFQGGRSKLVRQVYEVSGTYSVPELGIELDLSECVADSFRLQDVFSTPSGPKGKPLANDAPEGAIALDAGDTARAITAQAEEQPEIEPSCLIDPEFGVVFGRSVW